MRKSDSPLVSIIIPVFNNERFIDETLKSIYNQNYPTYEVIVIDDGSTDKTRYEIEKHRQKNLKYFYQNNFGVSKSRNTGLELSKGEYVCFFDSDDLMSDGFIESRLNHLMRNGEVFCGGDVIPFSKAPNYSNSSFTSVTENIFQSILYFDERLMTCPSSYLIRADTLKESGIRFNEKLSSSADKFFILELAEAFKYGYVLSSPLYYRRHSKSMSAGVRPDNIRDSKIYLNAVIKKFKLTPSTRRKFCALKNYNISAEYFALSKLNFAWSLLYLIKSLYHSPRALKKLLSGRI